MERLAVYTSSIPKNKQQGLSLLEVMVVLVVLSTTLVLILRSFSASLRATHITKGYAIAELLAEDKLWQMQQLGAIAVDVREEGNFPEPYETFSYELETRAAEDVVADGLNEVLLTVQWRAGRRTNKLELVTYLENQELQ
ncbi:prepilin-type N-terminal cleavage/methylation domain-containing protein [Candidatus Omnitrophota bacterium]